MEYFHPWSRGVFGGLLSTPPGSASHEAKLRLCKPFRFEGCRVWGFRVSGFRVEGLEV